MIIIADTSPINYLILIGEIEILPKLFGEVIIPQAVFVELNHPKASQIVRDFIADKPDWLKVVSVKIKEDEFSCRAGNFRRDFGKIL